MDQITLKLTLRSTTRRVRLARSSLSSWGSITELIHARFNPSEDDIPFALVFRDDDGDDITVSSDAELEECFADLSRDTKVVRFVIQPLGQDATMRDSSAAASSTIDDNASVRSEEIDFDVVDPNEFAMDFATATGEPAPVVEETPVDKGKDKEVEADDPDVPAVDAETSSAPTGQTPPRHPLESFWSTLVGPDSPVATQLNAALASTLGGGATVRGILDSKSQEVKAAVEKVQKAVTEMREVVRAEAANHAREFEQAGLQRAFETNNEGVNEFQQELGNMGATLRGIGEQLSRDISSVFVLPTAAPAGTAATSASAEQPQSETLADPPVPSNASQAESVEDPPLNIPGAIPEQPNRPTRSASLYEAFQRRNEEYERANRHAGGRHPHAHGHHHHHGLDGLGRTHTYAGPRGFRTHGPPYAPPPGNPWRQCATSTNPFGPPRPPMSMPAPPPPPVRANTLPAEPIWTFKASPPPAGSSSRAAEPTEEMPGAFNFGGRPSFYGGRRSFADRLGRAHRDDSSSSGPSTRDLVLSQLVELGYVFPEESEQRRIHRLVWEACQLHRGKANELDLVLDEVIMKL